MGRFVRIALKRREGVLYIVFALWLPEIGLSHSPVARMSIINMHNPNFANRIVDITAMHHRGTGLDTIIQAAVVKWRFQG